MQENDYTLLLDAHTHESVDAHLELPAGVSVVDAARVIEGAFQSDADLRTLSFVVGGEPLGLISRHNPLWSATLRGIGAGDGATLPGTSNRFRVLRLVCRQCSAIILRIRLEPREQVDCPQGHGSMELQS
jgi:hypothetical protein